MNGAAVAIARLRGEAAAVGFDASLTDATGNLLTVLAASKPGGRILELGTGAGVGTAYLLLGADRTSTLTTVELDPHLSGVAQQQITDERVEWVVGDGGTWLQSQPTTPGFDLVFADTWPGKFTHLDQVMAQLAPGGLYVIDDLLPQPNWPDHHQRRVDDLLTALRGVPDLAHVTLDWATGIAICTKRASSTLSRPGL